MSSYNIPSTTIESKHNKIYAYCFSYHQLINIHEHEMEHAFHQGDDDSYCGGQILSKIPGQMKLVNLYQLRIYTHNQDQ